LSAPNTARRITGAYSWREAGNGVRQDRRAEGTGAAAALREVPGDEFTVIDQRHESWSLVRAEVPDLLSGRLTNAGAVTHHA